MFYNLFLQLRYYYMITFGYKGAYLFCDHNSSSPERWQNRVHWTKFVPAKLIFSDPESDDRYWYTANELRHDFHNSFFALKDRIRDTEETLEV